MKGWFVKQCSYSVIRHVRSFTSCVDYIYLFSSHCTILAVCYFKSQRKIHLMHIIVKGYLQRLNIFKKTKQTRSSHINYSFNYIYTFLCKVLSHYYSQISHYCYSSDYFSDWINVIIVNCTHWTLFIYLSIFSLMCILV